jgi:hypothetical protein
MELPGVAAGHAQLDARHVGGVLIFFVRLEADMPRAEIGRPQDVNAELVDAIFLSCCADIASRTPS